MSDNACQFGLVVRRFQQAALDEQISAGQRECVDFAGLQHGDVQRNLQIGFLCDALPDSPDVFLDRFVFDFGRHEAEAFHFLDRLRAALDIVLLFRLDFAESDVLYVSPSPRVIRSARQFLLDLFVLSGPLLNDIEFRIQIVVGRGDCLSGEDVGFALQQVEVLNVAMGLLALLLGERRRVFLEILARGVNLLPYCLEWVLKRPTQISFPFLSAFRWDSISAALNSSFGASSKSSMYDFFRYSRNVSVCAERTGDCCA